MPTLAAMTLRRLVASLACSIAVSGCAAHPVRIPRNVSVGSAARESPAAPVARASDPPRIVAMRFSSLDVARGSVWSGHFVTGTNVASLEVRSNLFSIDVPRTSFGNFAFHLNVFDTPPIFIRSYRLRVIARNASGAQSEEDLPFRIR